MVLILIADVAQSMVGDVDDAMKTLHNFYQIWDQYGAIPEYYHIPKASAFSGREKYPLRPGQYLQLRHR